jgi:hypothetical protein
MLMARAVGVNVRFATIVLMHMVDVSRPKAVIVVGETVRDARAIPDGKCGGGSQYAK